MELSSSLSMEMSGKPFLLEKRIRLLYAIREYGSISKAAKAVPMSYKSAWEAVDAMNALSPQPIVNRETGGKDGGGTTVTPYGERLLETYAVLEEEHRRFVERLSRLVDVNESPLDTIGRLGYRISARNQIQAKVYAIEYEDVNAVVKMRFKGGAEICSVITKEACDDLRIEVGGIVTAVFKSSHVKFVREEKEACDNRLEGKVISLEKGSKHLKVVVDIGGYDKVVSVLPVSSRLETDESVTMCIDARHIMIGS